MLTNSNPNLPSTRTEAGEAVLRFLTERYPEALRELSQHMREQAKTSNVARVKARFEAWAEWVIRDLGPKGPKQDPLEALILPPVKKKKEVTKVIDEEDDFEAIFLSSQEDQKRRERQGRIVRAVSDKAVKHNYDLIERFDKVGLSELITTPEVITFEEEGGYQVLMVYSITTTKRGVTTKHDYTANGQGVTISHPDMLIGLDGKRILRSAGRGDPNKEGGVISYAKALECRDEMYLKGYYEIDKHDDKSAKDREDLTVYYKVSNGKLVKISALEYQLGWENKCSAGG